MIAFFEKGKMVSFCFLLLCACSQNEERNVSPGFYHWKTELNLSGTEISFMDEMAAGQIYLRFFDVDWDLSTQMPIPIAILQDNSGIPQNIDIIPTVFLTNRTFKNLEAEKVGLLVENVLKKIMTTADSFPKHTINEIQMDCDWTESTRGKYFSFLEGLGSKLKEKNIKLSTTIRLHQIKYFKQTGIPPVDRGMLMFYNMGDLENPETTNSILDLPTAQNYLVNFEVYPLELDVALPIFSWGVLFREGKMIQLLNQLTEQDLLDQDRFLKIGENRFQLLKSTYLNGHYLYKGDEIRLERVPSNLLEESADLLKPLIQNQEIKVIFYHLDSTILTTYPHEVLEGICNRFH